MAVTIPSPTFYGGTIQSGGVAPQNADTPSSLNDPPKKGPTFTKTFLPKGYYLSCGVDNQAFLAPTQFNIKQIEATGKANGLNPIAVNANVGHYGTFDYQRNRDSAGNTTFYSGFTNVSNFDVGVYMESAGYSRAATSAIANGFALFKSSNFGDQLQALFRNLGYDTAAKGQVPACTIEVYY